MEPGLTHSATVCHNIASWFSTSEG